MGLFSLQPTPLSLAVSLPLHLYFSLSLPLSSSCYLYSPVITLSISHLLLALITFCHLLSFSSSPLSVPPPSLSASSPPLQPNCTEAMHLYHITRPQQSNLFPSSEPRQ